LDSQERVFRASHNLEKVWTLPVNLLNAHDLLRRETLIMTVAAARQAEEMWASPLGHRQRSLPRSQGALSAAAAEEAIPDEPPPLEEEASSAPSRRRRRTPAEEENQE
jgi:hypothetical protein